MDTHLEKFATGHGSDSEVSHSITNHGFLDSTKDIDVVCLISCLKTSCKDEKMKYYIAFLFSVFELCSHGARGVGEEGSRD
jgi:hypothetical protein